MAKARRQSTPVPEPLRKLADELRKLGKSPQAQALRKLGRSPTSRKLAADLKGISASPAFQALRESLATTNFDKLKELVEQQESQEQAEQTRKARDAIDRYIAIRDNQIPPPWMTKPKVDGWQIRRIKQVLKKEFPPDGRPPADMTVKAVRTRVNLAFEKQGWKFAGYDSVARAIGRRT